MDLQTVAAVFDNVRINEVGDDAFAEEEFAEALRKKGGEIRGCWFSIRLQGNNVSRCEQAPCL